MSDRVQVVGLVRFSALSVDYYSERFGTVDKIAEHLFTDDRMALRFRLFEQLCLPTLAGQTDTDFICVVLTSETLPPAHLDHLRDLIAPYPHLRLFPSPVDRHYRQIKSGYASVDPTGLTHRASFRLDDDDAISLNYVRRLRRISQALVSLGDRDEPRAVSFNSGFYIRVRDGENDIFDATERAPLSTGTALVAPMGYPRNPYRYNHRALPQHFSTYQDISEPAFIRTIHSDNKSTPTQMGLTETKSASKVRREIMQGFGLDVDVLKAL